MSAEILLVDDDHALCKTLEAGLSRRGLRVTGHTSASDALRDLEEGSYDVVVTDLHMREMNGLELCERIAQNRSDVPVIVLTAFGSLDSAVAAIRAGAYDFISKPVEINALALAIERAARHRRLHEEVKRLRREVAQRPRDGALLGDSAPMRRLHELLARLTESEATVLVAGESGTGKEVVARAIHERSRRSAGPFVTINCTATPEPLLEGELFGHLRGAPDSRESRPGLFAQARGGTLFFDEIGDMSLGLQPRLLRALEERTLRPVGGASEIALDIRVIAATSRDLESAVNEGRFSEALYYRLNVVPIALPPLRARGADVLTLAHEFVRRYAAEAHKDVKGFSKEVADKLCAYAWPGNVRELQNSMERAVALTRVEEICVDDLPEKIRDYRFSHVVVAGNDPAELVPLEEVERRYILRVLEAVAGNKAAAARVLGLERSTLYRKLEGYGVGEPGRGDP